MKERLKRATSLILAVMILITTCLTGLPEGSLSFLGGVSGQVASLFEKEDATAAETVKIYLSKQYNSFGISEISRVSSEGLWFFGVNSKSGTPVFCENSGMANCGANYDTYTAYKTNASSYDDQSLAKVMTWYFGSKELGYLEQGSYTYSSLGTLSAKSVRIAVQAYVWARCTSGANITTTITQALSNAGVSNASSWASQIVSAVSSTTVYGKVIEYKCSNCTRSKDKSKHQVMLGWEGSLPKWDSMSDTATKEATEWVEISIKKVEGNTGSEYAIDTATFQVKVDGKLLKNVGTVTVETGTYTKSTSKFKTKGGSIVFYVKRTTTLTAKSGTYTYVTDRGSLSGSLLKKWMAANGVDYEDESSAKAQMNADLKADLAKQESEWLKKQHTWTVTETKAPDGFSLPATTTKTFTETNSYTATKKADVKIINFKFTDTQHYARVKVDKDRDTSVDVDTGSVATLKGATYTIYAAEKIVSYASGKKVTYDKGAKVTSFQTTTTSGIGYSDYVLPAGYKYYIQETKAPTGYKLNSTKTYFKIYYDATNGYRYKIRTTTKNSDGTYKWTDYIDDDSKTVDLTKTPNEKAFLDKPIVIKIKVFKTQDSFTIDATNKTDLLNEVIYEFNATNSVEKATFDIIDTATGKTVATLDTSNHSKTVDGVKYGYDTSVKLPVGKYKVVQTSGPALTTLTDSWTVNAKGSEEETLTYTYYKDDTMQQWGHVKVYKRQDVGGVKSAETGAVFTLYVKTTDSNGKTVWRSLGDLTYIDDTTKSGYGYYAFVKSVGSDGTLNWIDLPVGYSGTRYTYKIVQTGGSTEVYWMEDQTFQFSYTENPSSKKTVTKTFTATDGSEPMIEIHKDKTYVDENGEAQSTAEGGAVFYVLESTSSSGYYVHDYSKNATSGKITISSSTITADELMAKLDDSDRAAYLEALKAKYPDLVACVLTTDSDGDAESGLGKSDKEKYFMIIQASGEDYYELTDGYCFTVPANSTKVYYYEAEDPKYQADVSIYKTTREIDGTTNSEKINPEAEAVFAVLRADKVDGTTSNILSALKAKSAGDRKEYVYGLIASATGKSVDTLMDMTYAQVAELVEGLSQTDAVASLIVTDEDGNGYDVIDCAGKSEEFIVVQIAGEYGYDLADPESFEYVYGGETESFSFEWTDPASQTSVEITKTMTDSFGNNEQPEEGAQFYILKSSVLEDGSISGMGSTQEEALAYLTALDSSARLTWAAEAVAAGYSLGTVETDADGTGKAIWKDADWSGSFVILQTCGADGYSILDAKLSTDTSKVTVDTSDEYLTSYSFSGVDKGPGAYLYIEKEYQTGNNTWKAESGATFDVYDDQNQKVAEIKTGSDGTGYAVLPGTQTPAKLPINSIYTIKNTGVGAANVSLAGDEDIYIKPDDACKEDYATVEELKAAGTGVCVSLGYTIKNTANDYRFILTKLSSDTGEPVNGAVYEITALEPIYETSGTATSVIYKQGETVKTLTTGQNDSSDPDSTDDVTDGTVIPDSEASDTEITATSEAQEIESQEATEGEVIEGTEDEEESEEDDNGEAGDVDGEDGGAADGGTTGELSKVTGDGTAYTYLPYGSYAVKETYSPEGFVTSEETIYFRIDEEGITYLTVETDDSGNIISWTDGKTEPAEYDEADDVYVYSVSVEAEDTPVYGTISVEKTGDALGLGSYDETTSSFAYTSIPLEGVKFALYAADDIKDDAGNIVKYVGTDGKVHEMTAVEQNDTTATPIAYVTTDADGKATFEWTKVIQYDNDSAGISAGDTETTDQFYLGSYWVVEVETPYGWTLDSTWYQATISTSVLAYESSSTSDVENTGSAHGNAGPYESTGPYVLTTGEKINEILLGDDAFSSVTKIVFSTSYSYASYPDGACAAKYDVSADGDGTVWLVVPAGSSTSKTAYIVADKADQVVYLNAVSGSMFKNCTWIESIEFNNVDTSLLEDMSYMFYNCTGLTFLDLSDWDTTSVGWVQYSFALCSNLETVWVDGIEWEPNGDGGDDTLVKITAEPLTTFTCEYEDASGNGVLAQEITWEDFQFTAYYSQSYLASYLQQEITLTEDDIADITPDTANEDYAPDGWKESDEDSFTMTVTITLSENSEWYCTDGSRSNEITAEITVRCPDKIKNDVSKTEHPAVTISVDDTPATLNVRMRKNTTGDDETDNTVEGATFVLYANVDILDIDGNVLVKAGTEIGRQVSAGDGFQWSEFYYLPTDQYAGTNYQEFSTETYNIGFTYNAAGEQVEDDDISSGNYMYKVVEIPPSGYKNYTIEDKEVVWYFSGDLSKVKLETAGDVSVSFETYAQNPVEDYITVSKIWDDTLNTAGERPEFVMMRVSGNDSVYYIVMTEETTYLIKQPTASDSASAMIIDNLDSWFTGEDIPTLSQLVAYASYSKPTTVITDEGTVSVGEETEEWRVVLDCDGWTKLNGTTADFVSPFTKDSFSTWTFKEGIDLLKKMVAANNPGVDVTYDEEYGNGSGSYNAELAVWQAKNVLTVDSTDASVAKTWTDDDDADGYRPTSLTVRLYRKVSTDKGWSYTGTSKVLNESIGWQYTVYDLATTNAAGETYSYMWQEYSASSTSGDYYYTFETGTDGVKRMYVYDNETDDLLTVYTAAEDYTYNAEKNVWETTIGNTSNSKEASVRKVWEDADESDLPDDTYMTLWAWTDTDDTGEPPVDDISQWTQVDITGSTAAHYTSTSTISGTVTDTAVELNSANDWAATLKNLPKYDTSGTTKRNIYYMFREAQAGDTVVVNGTLLTLAEDWLTDYEASYDGGGTTELTTVTNTLTGGTGHITVSKKILASDLEKLSAFDMVPVFTFTLSWTETDSAGSTSDKSEAVTLVFATEADYADKAQAGVTYAYLADDAEADEEGYLTVSYIWEELSYNTYTVTESGGDAWYELSDILAGLAQSIDLEAKSAEFVIDKESKDYEFEAVFTNTLRTGNLSIYKKDADGNALGGVEFALYTAAVTLTEDEAAAAGITAAGQDVTYGGASYRAAHSGETWYLYDPQEAGLLTEETDEAGYAQFDSLMIGTYVLVETTSANGLSLLEEPVVVTIPLALTQDEVDAYKAAGISINTSDAYEEDGTYWFYRLTYTITNTADFDMPFTGSLSSVFGWKVLALLVLAGAMFLAAGFLQSKACRKRRKGQEI